MKALSLNISSFLIVACMLSLCACSTPKDILYFQDLHPGESEVTVADSLEIRVRPEDKISIIVNSRDPQLTDLFNLPYVSRQLGRSSLQGSVGTSQGVSGYTVDDQGNIDFPVLGKIHVAGMTRQELATKMQEMISKYVEKPLVNVQLLNFKVTLMGELNRPGSYTIKNDRVTILDVIGMAGDLPLTANRKNILVIRENDGQKEIHRMDITDPAIFESPCFYLKQNDVVYVEPIKIKQRARTSSDRQFTMSVLTSLISSVSIITSMVITIVNLNRNNK